MTYYLTLVDVGQCIFGEQKAIDTVERNFYGEAYAQFHVTSESSRAWEDSIQQKFQPRGSNEGYWLIEATRMPIRYSIAKFGGENDAAY